MPYSSQKDIFSRYNKVATVNLTAEEWGTFITDADAMIDAALAERYATPIGNGTPEGTPPILRYLSSWYALMLILDRMPNTPEWIVRAIERAERILEALRAGEMTIVGVTGGVIAELTDRDVIRVSTSGYVPTFGVAPSLSETVDPARATDEEDAR